MIRRLVPALALLLTATAAEADTQISQNLARCGNKGPYHGRTDSTTCVDTTNYGPLLVIDGSPEWAFPSSLYNSVRNDFLGNFTIPDVDSADGEQGIWGRQDAGSQGTCGTKVGDADDGAMILLLDNNNEVGDCTVYWGDEQNIDSDTGPVMIARVQVSDALAAADKVFWGLGSARNAILESMTQFVGFSVTGADYVLDNESDDNTTDVAPTGTGVTLTADTYYEFMICANALCGGSATNVKMFYRASLGGDWTATNASTTFSVGADVALQPIFQSEKTSGTTTPGIQVDYAVVYWKRS